MKTITLFFMILFAVGCNENKDNTKEQLATVKVIGNALAFSNSSGVKEVCLNGVVYYKGWGGSGNGGPMLSVKIVPDEANRPLVERCN